MRSKSKARLLGLAASMHVRNRTYQISLPPGRGRYGFEISLCNGMFARGGKEKYFMGSLSWGAWKPGLIKVNEN